MYAHQQWRWGGAGCKGHPPPHLNHVSQRLETLVTATLHQQRHAEVACLEPLTHLYCAKGAYSEPDRTKKKKTITCSTAAAPFFKSALEIFLIIHHICCGLHIHIKSTHSPVLRKVQKTSLLKRPLTREVNE